MPEKHRELSKFVDYIESWNRKNPLWIHLKGQPGVGKTYFIDLLLTKKLTDYTTLFKVNSFFLLLPYHGQIQAIFGYLYRYHKKDVKLFSGKYPNFVRSNIIKIFNGTIKNIGDNIYSHHFSQNLLIKFIEFLSNRKNIVILFDGGLEFSVLQSMWLFDFFFKKCTFPALIITSVVSGNSEETQLDEEHTIKVDRMSVQEIHKFVELILHTNKINARLVTNHLQIKSQGNPRKIKYLIEGFYRQIIPQKTEELVDNRTLQNLRIHSANEFIFSKIIKHLSDPELSIFILLSNLDDPFPLKLLKDILKELEVNEADFFNRLSTYLEEREIFGQKFFNYFKMTITYCKH